MTIIYSSFKTCYSRGFRAFLLGAVMAMLLLGPGVVPAADEDAAVTPVSKHWDHRGDFPPTRARVGKHHVPRLDELRRGHWEDEGKADGALNPPVPGGIGAGVLYRQGQLAVFRQAQLQTKMIVWPNGIGVPSNFATNWIMTSATNRTEQGVEVVGIYYEPATNGQAVGSLGIFDWSCSVTAPCPSVGASPFTGPSWVWIRQLPQMSCYYSRANDGGGHRHQLLYYRNATTALDFNTPPLWQNSVTLWNYCSRSWNLVYSHNYRVQQKYCSMEAYSCGWWGPIVETWFPEPQPPIAELGYLGATLLHDGIASKLGPTETDWVPPYSWVTYHLNPNGSWGVGP